LLAEKITPMNVSIATLTAAEIERALPQLVGLFQDAIDSGAALGFLPPLTADEASSFWRRVGASVEAGTLALFVARDGHTHDILGSVQLALAPQTNGTHRAEVAKMMVHSQARRLGIGRELLRALEAHAAQLGRTTLVLDTRQGDTAEQLYQALQYKVAGVVPEYAQSGDGTLHSTVIYYKLLTA
jgi:ribosomal protein S18 acetylase RimI-like enzyme